MTIISRRTASRLLVGGAAAAGLTIKSPAVWSQANITKIKAGIVPVMDAGGFFAAQSQGFFAAERLEVEVVPTPGGGPSMAALASGQWQVAMSTVTTMIQGVEEGVDFRMITPVSAVYPPPQDSTGIMVRKGTIKSGADTAGKTGASHLLQNLLWVCMRMWIDRTGGDSSKVNIIEVRFPQQADALLQGRIDFVACGEPFTSAQLAANPDKLEVISGNVGAMMPGTVLAAFAATQSYIDKNKEVIAAFVRAQKKGQEWCEANKGNDALIKLLAGFTQLPPERLQAVKGWPTFATKIDPANMDQVSEAMKKYGMLKAVTPASTYVYETARG